MKVTTELETYDDPRKPNIRVHSHWSSDSLVVIECGDERWTLCARQLQAAIQNATNVK